MASTVNHVFRSLTPPHLFRNLRNVYLLHNRSSEHAQAYFEKSSLLPRYILYFITLKDFCMSTRDETVFAITVCCVKMIKILETMNLLLYCFILSTLLLSVLGWQRLSRAAGNAQNLATSNQLTTLINDYETFQLLGGCFLCLSERGSRILLGRELMINLLFSDHIIIYQKKILVFATYKGKGILK